MSEILVIFWPNVDVLGFSFNINPPGLFQVFSNSHLAYYQLTWSI